MTRVNLVRLDAAIEASLEGDPAFLDAMMKEEWSQAAEVVLRHFGRKPTATTVSAETLDWGGYYAVDAMTRELVGSCGFKGGPSEDGTVEVAYFTYPDSEGKGYATAMAHELIELAKCSAKVKRLIAHTLPRTSASTQVLEKNDMTFAGEVNDPDDGKVWRWKIELKR